MGIFRFWLEIPKGILNPEDRISEAEKSPIKIPITADGHLNFRGRISWRLNPQIQNLGIFIPGIGNFRRLGILSRDCGIFRI